MSRSSTLSFFKRPMARELHELVLAEGDLLEAGEVAEFGRYALDRVFVEVQDLETTHLADPRRNRGDRVVVRVEALRRAGVSADGVGDLRVAAADEAEVAAL